MIILQFAELHASGQLVTYSRLRKVLELKGSPKSVSSVHRLAQLEEQYDIIDIFLWLR